jgi:hypothetical protein
MELPIGNIVTAIGTVISVVIANKLSFSQSGQAKLLDSRRQAYGVILSELASVERVCATADEHMAEDEYRYFESDAREAHNKQIGEHMKAARQRFSDDYLILSDQFIERFETFAADLAGPPDEGYPEGDERFSKAIRKHRPLLLAQARSETAAQSRRFLDGFPARCWTGSG